MQRRQKPKRLGRPLAHRLAECLRPEVAQVLSQAPGRFDGRFVGVSVFERAARVIESQAALLFRRPVALDAMRLEDGPNISIKVDLLGLRSVHAQGDPQRHGQKHSQVE